jgi:hypothetical protein
MYIGLNVFWEIVYVHKEQDWAKNRALMNTSEDWEVWGLFSVDYNALLTTIKEARCPIQNITSYTVSGGARPQNLGGGHLRANSYFGGAR